MTTSLLIRGLILFVVTAIVVRKTTGGKISRNRAIVISGVSTAVAVLFLQHINIPEAIAHWVQTGNFR